MADEKLRSTSKKSGGNRREGSSEAPRPTMAFRVNAGLYEKIRSNARTYQLTITEEIERLLTRSFELEAVLAGKERYVEAVENMDRMLWPDAEARALGQAFAMTLAAARHSSGQDWRDDLAVPLVVAGAMRRLMDRVTRNSGSLYAGLAVDSIRAAAAADGIAALVGPVLDKAMPPLPEPAFDVRKWTGRVFLVTEFRDAATGEVLETVTGPECDVTSPDARPLRGDGYRAALARFHPIREKVDVEDFQTYVLHDGMTARVRLDVTPAGPNPHAAEPPIPTSQAPTRAREPAPLPDGARWATPEELAELHDAPGQLPPSIGDRALFDDAVSGLPLVKAEKAAEAKRRAKQPLDVGTVPLEPAPAPKRSRRTKAGT